MMDTPLRTTPPSETDRVRRERDKIERARRQFDSGQFLEGEELDRWLGLYDASEAPTPVPVPRHPPADRTA
jgi:hypothetical protein